MRPILLMASAAALMTSACDEGGRRTTVTSLSDDGGPLKVVNTLQCPQTHGPLTRKGGPSADGLSCVYVGPRGAEVTLHLVSLGDDGAAAALQTFETQLSAELPAGQAEMISAPAPQESIGQDGDTAVHITSKTVDGVEHAEIRMPGVDIRAQGEDAVVRLPGVLIDASGDRAVVRIGGLKINADDGAPDGSTLETPDAVNIVSHGDTTVVRTRAPGRSVRASFVLTDDSGERRGLWRVVGYEARGPSGGPIVVATVKAKGSGEDEMFGAARQLVRLNVGD